MTVGVLITNYYAWPFTQRALTELVRHCGKHTSHIVVVDDCSDAPAEFDEHNNVLIHHNLKNLGYARSINVGMKLLADDVIVVLDCDAYPLLDLMPGVVANFAANPRLGALGFSAVDSAGRVGIAAEREPTVTHFVLGQRIANLLGRHNWLAGKRVVIHSCCMAIRRISFEEVKGFDESFDFLDADIDFSLRLQEAGWQIDVDSTLLCFHRGGGSPQRQSARVIRFHQNRWKLLRKYHQHLRAIWLIKAILLLRHLIEFLALLILRILRFGAWENLGDKLEGRGKLIRSVWRDYRFSKK
jgi:GT2 family glycosyltransferase